MHVTILGPVWDQNSQCMEGIAPLNIDISKRQTQHKNIQLLLLRRKRKKHCNDIVNALSLSVKKPQILL